MLTVSHLQSAYGDSQVLFDVSFTVGAGEVVTLLGRNGMGKTTTVSSIMGLVRPRGGEVAFEGRPLTGLPPYRIAQCGIGLVPEGRQVFPTLSVHENLVATAAARAGAPRWTLERVYELFPRLRERRDHLGSQLSGGEQQMLAIGRALMTNPSLLIMDEPSEGLAPSILDVIQDRLLGLRKSGLSLLIAEQNVDLALDVAERVLVLDDSGTIAWSGAPDELRSDGRLLERHLSI